PWPRESRSYLRRADARTPPRCLPGSGDFRPRRSYLTRFFTVRSRSSVDRCQHPAADAAGTPVPEDPMANPNANRPPSTRKRMFWTLLITVLVFGGVFALWGAMRTMMNSFFDDMPQPPVSVATFEARAERWSGRLEAVGTLVAVNGTDVTTEAGGVVQ